VTLGGYRDRRERPRHERRRALEGTSLEHTVIFPNATVRNGDIRRSIIDQGTHLEDLDLAGALIGAHTTITNGAEQ